MKKVFISMLFVLGMATGYESEKTTDSIVSDTIHHTKSGREDGFIIRSQISFPILIENLGRSYGFAEIQGVFAYRLSSYLTLGLGSGAIGWYDAFSEYHDAFLCSAPLYLNVRAFLSNRLWSPYIEISGGFYMNLNQQTIDLTSDYNHSPGTQYYYYYQHTSLKGSMWDLAFGVQYKNIDCSLTLKKVPISLIYDYKYRQFDDIDHTYKDYSDSHAHVEKHFCVSLNISYNFILGHKQNKSNKLD